MSETKPTSERRLVIRHDIWTPPEGGRKAMLLVSTGRDCLCIVLAVEPRSGDVWIGRAHLTADAADASREAIAACVRLSPAKGPQMAAVILHDDRMDLAKQVLVYANDFKARSDPRYRLMQGVIKRTWRDGRPLGGHDLMADGRVIPLDASLAPGYLDAKEHPNYLIEVHDWTRIDPHPGTTGGGPRVEFALDDLNLDAISKTVSNWRYMVAKAIFPASKPYLRNRHHWSNALLRHHRAEGLQGLYRQQAAELHPAFVPILRADAKLSSLIDAGRPFEAALVERLRPFIPPGEREGLTLPKIRRMRSLGHTPSLAMLRSYLSWCARLPLAVVPETRNGWYVMQSCIQHAGTWVECFGLDLRTLFEGPFSRMPKTEIYPSWGGSLIAAVDMVRRFRDTVALPGLPGLDDKAGMRAAARLLFEGLSATAIDRAQKEWHRRLPFLESALPEGKDFVSWPPLAQDWTSPAGNVRIVFLTKQSELREEGRFGAGRDGREGLMHCVGGYAPRCYEAACHVASVRTRAGEGWARASTAEFVPDEQGGVTLAQHKGRANGEPPPEAALAMGSFLADLASGRHPVDPGAVRKRTGDGYRDGIDWSSRAMRETALDAWRPFLLPRTQREGYDAVIARLSTLTAP